MSLLVYLLINHIIIKKEISFDLLGSLCDQKVKQNKYCVRNIFSKIYSLHWTSIFLDLFQ